MLGVCGGFQMLGRTISDPEGVEGPPGEAPGLGLLDVETVLTGDKVLRPTAGRPAFGRAFRGATRSMWAAPRAGPPAPLLIREDGGGGGRGLSRRPHLRRLCPWPVRPGRSRTALLAELGAVSDGLDEASRVDAALDEIAGPGKAFDIPLLASIAGLESFR